MTTTPDQCVPMSAIQAMHNRYKCSMLMAAACGNEDEYQKLRGMALAMFGLIHWRSAAVYAAKNDVLIGGYQPLGGFEGPWMAWDALPNNPEMPTFAQMKQFLAAIGFKWPDDDIPDTQLDAVVQFKDNEVAAVNADDEHDPLGAELNDGALLHGSPCVVSAIVAQGGAA